jgi:DegV family protein with EDD domain
MNSICILTDNTAQFPQPAFLGRDLVHVLPLSIKLNDKLIDDTREIKKLILPITAGDTLLPAVVPPSPDRLVQLFQALNRDYNEIVVITVSSKLSGTFSAIQEAIRIFPGGSRIHLIDSLTISIGLGILVQIAAESAYSGLKTKEIDRKLREVIPHIYSYFCTPSLSYLYHAGFIDYAQAIVSEYLNLYPLFMLEDGQLSPQQKVRSYRNALESFMEFLDEFDHLRQISLIQGGNLPPQETRQIKQFSDENFPKTPFTEHQITPYLATMFGPSFLGLFIHENSSQ